MSFRFLEHTADVQVECRAASFEGILEWAARALYATALKQPGQREDTTCRVEAQGACREEVLIRWLQDLLFRLDTEGFVGVTFAFETVSDQGVAASVRGYRCTPQDRAEEVKAATYHALTIQQDDGGLVARVIFDL